MKRNVEVALVNTDGTQTRVATSAEHIEDLAAVLLANDDLPPVDLRRDPETSRYWIVDGYHRVMAHILAKRKVVNAFVSEGSRSDALWDACGSNPGHGLRRTNLDKRKAIRIALEHRYGQEDPADNAIAKHCHVSNHLVATVRAEMLAEQTQLGEIQVAPPAPKRRGADGRIRSLPKPPKVPAEAKAALTTARVKVEAFSVGPSIDDPDGSIGLARMAEVSGGSNRDALGQPIPEALGVSWQRLTARTNIVLAGLKEARAGVAALKTLTASNPKALDSGQRDALHRFGADLDAMMVRAEGYRPHAVCADGPCSRCKGRGWMTKAEHLAMVRGQEAKR